MQKQFVTAGGWKFSLINNDEQDANIIKEQIKNFREPNKIPDNAFLNFSSLTQISIPSSVTRIGNLAFACCSSLTQITIPSNMTSIGNAAFQECSSLTQILIPSSVTSIENGAFHRCSNLTQIEIPVTATTGTDVFAGCNSLRDITILIPNNVTYNNYIPCFSLFSRIPHDSNIKLKVNSSQISFNDNKDNPQKILLNLPTENQNVKDFIAWIFQNCTDLTKFTIPSNVTSIGECAFYGCTNLTQITIPSSVTRIGDYAFAGCSSLTQISIPSSVTRIGSFTFNCCSSLTQISIPKALSSQTRYWRLDKNVKIVVEDPQADNKNIQQKPELYSKNESGGWKFSVKNNDEQAKNRISEIIKNFPEPNKIPDRAFGNCENLIKIEIPSNVDSIGNFAFSWCSNLTQIEIPESVTIIGSSAFLNCRSLTQISIPGSVTSIGQCAFSGCSNLTQIKIPKDKQLISMVFDAITSSNIAPTITFTPNQSKEYNNSNIPPLEEKDMDPR